jgi:hypothetical protein
MFTSATLIRILRIILLSSYTAASHASELQVAANAGEQRVVTLVGRGSSSCGEWLSTTSHKREGAVWIYGFWSGLNYVAAASEQKQSQAGDVDILDAVEEVCRRDVSQILAFATWTAYVGRNASHSP